MLRTTTTPIGPITRWSFPSYEDDSILHMTKRCRQANLMEDNKVYPRNQMIEDIFGEDSDDDETVAAASY